MTFSFAGVRQCARWNSPCGDGGHRHEFSFRIHDMKSANDKGQVGAEYQGTLEEVWRIRGDTQRRLLGRHLPKVLADSLQGAKCDFEAVRNSELRALPCTVENRNLHGHGIRRGSIDEDYSGLPVWINRHRHLELTSRLDRSDLCARQLFSGRVIANQLASRRSSRH